MIILAGASGKTERLAGNRAEKAIQLPGEGIKHSEVILLRLYNKMYRPKSDKVWHETGLAGKN